MANPDDKIKDTSQLSKQESTAKKIQKVNKFFLLSNQIILFLLRRKRKLVYLSFNMEKGKMFMNYDSIFNQNYGFFTVAILI